MQTWLLPTATAVAGGLVISPRKVLVEIRREMQAPTNRRNRSYRARLQNCRADERE